MKRWMWMCWMMGGCKPAEYAEPSVPSDIDPGGSDTATLTTTTASACDAPLDGPVYEEVGLSMGLGVEHIDTAATQGHVDGPSIALADIDGDSFPELAVLREENGDSALYSGTEGGFERIGRMEIAEMALEGGHVLTHIRRHGRHLTTQ